MLNIKSLHVTARNFLCFLIMFLMFSYCFVQVHASETDEEETTLSAVLQDGGLLEEETDSGIMAFRMADQGEMERMLVAAVENLQGNIPMREYGMTVSELSTFLIKFLNNHPPQDHSRLHLRDTSNSQSAQDSRHGLICRW